MPTGKDVIDEARKYLRTPFHHQGRLKGVGIDCVGLLVCVGRALGVLDRDNTTYSRQPDSKLLLKELDAVLDIVPLKDIRIGDILLFWFAPRKRFPQHIAFFTGKGLLHTYANAGMVIEHEMTEKWAKRLCRAYRFRGLT